MIITPGTAVTFFQYRKLGKNDTARIVFNDKSNNTTILNTVRKLGDGLEFAISREFTISDNLPATADLQINNVTFRSVTLEAPVVADEATQDELDQVISTVETKEAKPNLAGLPFFAYGASYSTLNQAYHTSGKQYIQLTSEALNGGSVTSYGVNGRRAIDVANALMSSSGMSGVNQIVAGAPWPGVSNRTGIVVHDALGNDIMNQAAQNAASITVVGITGTNYLNYLKQHYRTALALMSTETRVENHTHTTTSGTGWQHSAAGVWASGGTTCYTTTVGDYAEYSVTPPQRGPMAGKVFVVVDGDIPAVSVFADVDISVDGGAATKHTTFRHTYTGQNGTQIKGAYNAIPVTLPTDGAAHTIRITHAGSEGHFMIVDCLLIPSVNPNLIACMGVEHSLATHASGLDATDLTLYNGNSVKVHQVYKEAVAEFPHAVYVPSTMTLNGLWTSDGIHPNDRGMQQRANDLIQALRARRARFDNEVLRLAPNSDFGKI